METTAAGGINKTVRELARNLSKMGHEITVLQPNPLGLAVNEVLDNYRIIRMNLRIGVYLYGFDYKIYIYLKKYLTELNPDVIHIHGYHSLFSFEAILIIKLLLKSSIGLLFSPHYGINSHDTLVGKYLWNTYNLLGFPILKLTDKIICASVYESDNIKLFYNIDLDKIIVISHGVDKIQPNIKPKNNNNISLLSAGYLLELKGFHFILYSLYELIYNYKKNVNLTIVGEGNYESKLVELSNKLSITNAIKWCPFLETEELLNKIKYADIFLLLSKSENFGIVVAEALALGTPCVVTNITALSEFLKEPGCFGVDYPPDPKKVAELILKISERKINVGPFSDKIRTWDKVVEDYEKIYLSIK